MRLQRPRKRYMVIFWLAVVLLFTLYQTRTRVIVSNESGQTINWIRISGVPPERVFRDLRPGATATLGFWCRYEGGIEVEGQMADGSPIAPGMGGYLLKYKSAGDRYDVAVSSGGAYTINGNPPSPIYRPRRK